MSFRRKIAIVFISILLVSMTLMGVLTRKVEAQRITRDEAVIIGNIGAPILNWNIFAVGGSYEWATWQLLYPAVTQQDVLRHQWLLFLIDRIEFNGDELTITIHIRDEARWSDGTPITADDIIDGYKLSRQVGAGLWGEWCVYNFEKVDDKTIKYYIARAPGEEPPPREEITMDWGGGAIGCVVFIRPVPVHVFRPIIEQLGEAMRADWRNDDPTKQVVSGPYKLYYADATQVVYERIDDWWGKDIFGLPAPKYIVFMYYKDMNVAIQALVNGDIDVLMSGLGGGAGIFVPNADELMTKYGIKLWSSTKPYFIPSAIYWLYLNHNNPIFANRDVRRAIAWAIPWEDITKYGLLELVEQAPVVGFVAKGAYGKEYINTEACQKYWGNPDCLLKQDLAKAREILDKANIIDRDGDGVRELPDRTPLKFTITVPSGAVLENNVASLIADALKKIGISVAIQALDYRVWWDNFRNSQFDATICWSAHGYEIGHIRNSYGNALYPQWGNMARWMGYSNDRLNALFEELTRAMIFPDYEKDLIKQIQEILFEDLPAIPIFYSPHFSLYNPKYWDGWPDAERPWWIPTWYGSLPIFFFLVKSGQPVEKPWWYAPVEQGGALISLAKYSEYLSNCIYKAQSSVIQSGKPVLKPSPSPTPTPTVAPSPSPSPSPSPTPTPTVAPSPSPSPSPSPTPTPTVAPGTVTITVTTSVIVESVRTVTVRETELSLVTALSIGLGVSIFIVIVSVLRLFIGKKK